MSPRHGPSGRSGFGWSDAGSGISQSSPVAVEVDAL